MNNGKKSDLLVWGSSFLSAIVAIAAFSRVYYGSDIDQRVGTTTLTYFAVAGALLVLRRVKSLSFGDTKVELRDLEERAAQATELAKAADDATRMSFVTGDELKATDRSVEPGPHPYDPWKGQFGGKAELNGRRLSASVVPIIEDEDWYLIRLTVKSLDIAMPLKGQVEFFLHDSFPNPRRIVRVVAGKAELRLRAVGAFTVGVLADSGQTKLELDLAEDDSFPKKFRER